MSNAAVTLQLSQYIKADRAKVFAAWTQIEHIKQWFCPGDMTIPFAEADARIGGQYRIQMQNSQDETFTTIGEYLEIVPNEKLVFTWGWEGPERHESRVTVEFLDKEDGTEVRLLHENLQDAEVMQRHKAGWQGCLEKLAMRIDIFA